MLKAGIVGLPNVGKSTLFNAVTRTRKAEAANYPFCTIDPNVGIVTVPDARLERARKRSPRPPSSSRRRLNSWTSPASSRARRRAKVSATNSSRHIREVDAIVQVVRCFEDADIHHVTGIVDPVRDIEIITTELVLADLETVQKRREKLAKDAKRGDKAAARGGRRAGKIRTASRTPANPRSRSNSRRRKKPSRGLSSCSPTSRRFSPAT